jgi:hypothetical protein
VLCMQALLNSANDHAYLVKKALMQAVPLQSNRTWPPVRDTQPTAQMILV